MKSFEPSLKDKIAITEENIRGLCKTIFSVELAGRCAEKIGNKEKSAKSVATLTELEKMRMAYEEELALFVAEVEKQKQG